MRGKLPINLAGIVGITKSETVNIFSIFGRVIGKLVNSLLDFWIVILYCQ